MEYKHCKLHQRNLLNINCFQIYVSSYLSFFQKREANKFSTSSLKSALKAYPQNAQQFKVSMLSHSESTRLSNELASIVNKYGNYLVYAPPWIIVFATAESFRVAAHLCDIRVTVNNAGDVESVSFSTIITAKAGATGQCFYYGDKAGDALAHFHLLYKSLLMKCQPGSNRCASIVHFPLSLANKHLITDFHSSFGDRPKSSGDIITDAFIVVGSQL